MNRRPNVVLIVSDDHGYADRGILGIHPDVSTPALDRLAREGVTCTDAYVTAPICSPSRAGLISGRYQQRWGALWFDSSAFPPDGPSLGERFKADGHATGYLGKVHYGAEKPGDRACPPNHGFDETFYGLAGGQMGRLHYLRHSRAAVEEYGPEAWMMATAPMWEGDREVELEGFLTAELGRRARDFVARRQAEPFFLMLCFNAVHNFCWQLPDDELARRGLPRHEDWTPAVGDYGEWYDDAIAPNLPRGRDYYLAQLELMDAEIGRILAELDRLGLADDTVVAYSTDNGGSTCNFGDNAPLRGTKYTVWEGGIRVPMLVRWPGGGLPAGVRRSGLVSSLDLTPTLLAACGAQAPGTDGVDQLPLLRSGTASGHEALHWECGFQWAVREGDWKLSYTDPANAEVAELRRREHAPMGNGAFLADLASDPAETTNLADRAPEIVRRLTERHEAWRRGLR